MTTFADVVTLGATLGHALLERGWTLSTAESCTGGLIGHALTETPGSSGWYTGGAITYSNDAKIAVLGVHAATIEEYGAVSAQCAREMADGVRRLYGSQLALSVTGIAGPGGGTPDKPTGLVYIGFSHSGILAQQSLRAERHVWERDRSGNKLESARAALEIALRSLTGANQSS